MPRCYMVKKTLTKYQRECANDQGGADQINNQNDQEINTNTPDQGTSSQEYTYSSQPDQQHTNGYMDGYMEAGREKVGGRLRSAEETEAAHDLLELSRSLPPLPAPTAAVPAGLIAAPEHVYYCCEPQLTPPASEYSSDAENLPPAAEPPQTFPQPAVVYTYGTLLVTDGRSKNRGTRPAKAAPLSPSSSDDGAQHDNDEAAAVQSTQSDKGDRFVCSECGKKYATSSNLSRHKQTHRSLDSQSAKKCNTCGKAYVSMPALAMHLLTHKLSHACGICGKLFSRPWLLQGHLRSHTGEKPYGCAHCGKAFADRSNLRAHMQTHSQDKNFACSRCHKSFALKSYLNKHLESACLKDEGTSGPGVDVKLMLETVRSTIQVQ